MPLLHDLTCRRCVSRSLVATAIAAPIAALFGRVAFAESKAEAPVPGGPVTTHGAVLDTAAKCASDEAPSRRHERVFERFSLLC